MLVLIRKCNESFRVEIDGKLVDITIIGIDRNRVRVGIEADPSITVLRSELCKPAPLAVKKDRLTARFDAV